MKETKVDLVINKLTKAQYDAALENNEISDTELYFITDDTSSSGADLTDYYTSGEVDTLISNATTTVENYTDTKIADLVASSPEALNTLKELADALGNDADFATTVTNSLAGKQDTLVSSGDGQNIKTLNNESLLGTGNISIPVWTSSDIYTQTEINELLGNKVDSSALTSYDTSDQVNTKLASYLPLYAGSDKPLTGTLYTRALLPTTTGTYSLGSLDYKYNNLYLNGAIYNSNGNGLALPSKSGTIATTSDIPTDYTTASSFKTINGESIVGSGDITVASSDEDTGEDVVFSTESVSGANELKSITVGTTAWNVAADLSNYDTSSEVDAKISAEDTALKAYADQKVSDLVASSPDALNTLNELATALGNDANFSTTVTNAIAAKQDKLYDSGDNQNLKTINGNSLLGTGDITIEGGSGSGSGIAYYDELPEDTSSFSEGDIIAVPSEGSSISSIVTHTSSDTLTTYTISAYSSSTEPFHSFYTLDTTSYNANELLINFHLYNSTTASYVNTIDYLFACYANSLFVIKGTYTVKSVASSSSAYPYVQIKAVYDGSTLTLYYRNGTSTTAYLWIDSIYGM